LRALGEESPSLKIKQGLPVTRLPDVSLPGVEARAANARRLLTRLESLPTAGVLEEDLLSIEMLRRKLRFDAESPRTYWLGFEVTPYASPFGDVHAAFRAGHAASRFHFFSGAAVHLDGARLWESAAGYGCQPAKIAALFDTVYVSFYKGIGALPGCCVAGPRDIVDQVREWRERMGGMLFGLWPNAASALTCLALRLPRMAGYLEHAREIAAALAEVPGIRVIPDPPQTPMMHLLLTVTADRFAAVARELAAEQGIWTWPNAMTTADPAVQRIELSVGDATRTMTPAVVAAALAAFTAA
jgi:hypothetical protein